MRHTTPLLLLALTVAACDHPFPPPPPTWQAGQHGLLDFQWWTYSTPETQSLLAHGTQRSLYLRGPLPSALTVETSAPAILTSVAWNNELPSLTAIDLSTGAPGRADLIFRDANGREAERIAITVEEAAKITIGQTLADRDEPAAPPSRWVVGGELSLTTQALDSRGRVLISSASALRIVGDDVLEVSTIVSTTVRAKRAGTGTITVTNGPVVSGVAIEVVDLADVATLELERSSAVGYHYDDGGFAEVHLIARDQSGVSLFGALCDWSPTPGLAVKYNAAIPGYDDKPSSTISQFELATKGTFTTTCRIGSRTLPVSFTVEAIRD